MIKQVVKNCQIRGTDTAPNRYGTALGFMLALVIFAGIREHMAKLPIPEGMKGVPAALVVAGILALAFMGFSGLV